ncbi:MAG TPA: cell wall hydrolase [Methylocystis sp.]|nr:cell wall hydrolase [Methylocystis sp.]
MRRRSNARWAIAVIAPWVLSVGALVSFTASAGQSPSSGWSRAPRVVASLSVANDAARLAPDAPIQSAHLTDSFSLELHDPPDEREPHVDLKPHVRDFPQVDRTRKGDPVVAIRPSLDGSSRWTPFLRFIEGEAPRFDDDVRSKLLWAAHVHPREETDGAFSFPLLGVAGAALPEPQRPSVSEALRARAAHGATPAVSRAAALSSSTPAQRDALPVAIEAIPRAFLAYQSMTRPDYAALINPEKIDREKRCLAEAVYFEARSEPEAGQAAVAQVVLNRVSSGLYPDSICGVVYQNRHHYHACQFSFACEGKSLRITERDSWTTALRIADSVLQGRTYNSEVGKATHYHANYVRPRWARSLERTDKIGRHIFYKLHPGQT